MPFRGHAPGFLALAFAIERMEAGSFESRFRDGDLVTMLLQRKERGKEWEQGQLAVFLGYAEPRSGIQQAGVRVKRFEDEEPSTCWRQRGVRLVRYAGTRRKVPKRTPHTWTVSPNDFSAALLGADEDAWITGRSLIGFVGDFPTLKLELDGTLRVWSSEKAIEGSLSCILREGNTMFASARSQHELDALEQWQPELVVFDGGSAYRKWRHRFANAHQAVILDRASLAWEHEFDAVSSAYVQRSLAPSDGWPSTDGMAVDLIGFAV